MPQNWAKLAPFVDSPRRVAAADRPLCRTGRLSGLAWPGIGATLRKHLQRRPFLCKRNGNGDSVAQRQAQTGLDFEPIDGVLKKAETALDAFEADLADG